MGALVLTALVAFCAGLGATHLVGDAIDRWRDRRPYSAQTYIAAPRTLARFANLMQRRRWRALHKRTH